MSKSVTRIKNAFFLILNTFLLWKNIYLNNTLVKEQIDKCCMTYKMTSVILKNRSYFDKSTSPVFCKNISKILSFNICGKKYFSLRFQNKCYSSYNQINFYNIIFSNISNCYFQNSVEHCMAFNFIVYRSGRYPNT